MALVSTGQPDTASEPESSSNNMCNIIYIYIERKGRMEDGAREAKLLEVLKLLKARLACNLLGYRLCQ